MNMKVIEKFGIKFERIYAEELKLLTLELYRMVRASGYKPNCIVTLARGGFFPTRYYSDFSGINEVYTIKVEYYKDLKETFEKPKITQGLPNIDLKRKNIIVVEDVTDTGESLKTAVDYIKGTPREIRTAVLYLKPWSLFKPDYHVRETEAWALFDWEQREVVEGILNKDEVKQLSPTQLRKELKDLDIQKEIIDLVFEERNWI